MTRRRRSLRSLFSLTGSDYSRGWIGRRLLASREAGIIEDPERRRAVVGRALRQFGFGSPGRFSFWVLLGGALVFAMNASKPAARWILAQTGGGNSKWVDELLGFVLMCAISVGITMGWSLLRWRTLVHALRSEIRDAGCPICLHCGYDLRGATEPRCPECGTASDLQPAPPGADESSAPGAGGTV